MKRIKYLYETLAVALLCAPSAMAQVQPAEGGNMPKAADVSGPATSGTGSGGIYEMPKETREQKDARMKWFRDARYGLFIHWGPSSILGVETSWGRNGKKPMDCGPTAPPNSRDEVYDNLYKQFNPVNFDAGAWVKMARDAGMNYIVFTTKHHDGFCNFHTKHTDYSVASTSFKRDIVKELADACHKAGTRFGEYYSQRDWHHPDYLMDGNKKYLDYFHGQLTELLTGYGKVDLLWFDSQGGDWTDWDYPKMAKIILKNQPDILCNGRLGVLQGRSPRPNYDLSRLGDYQTPEQVIGGFQRDCYWESCACLVDGQWGYKPDGLLLTFREVLGMLLYSAGGDGNLLLDVAPTPMGNFEDRQIARLKEVGDWLTQYGESIYGTRGGPYKPGYWGVSTLNANKIYLHVVAFDGDTLTLPALPAKIVGSKLLTGGEVDVRQASDALTLKVAPKHQQKADTLIELTIDGNAFDIKPIQVKNPDSLVEGWGKDKKYALVSVKSDAPPKRWWHNPCGPANMFDNCRLTSWVPAPGTTQAVVTLNLEQPTRFQNAVIECDGDMDGLDIAIAEGTNWKSLGTFANLGGKTKLNLPETTAQTLRLTFKTRKGGEFRIWEFQLF